MKALSALVFMVVIVALSGCASNPPPAAVPLDNVQQRIYLVYRNWHTSIVVDAAQLERYSPRLAGDSFWLAANVHQEKFVRVGWGDGDYFTGKSKSWGSATRALLASNYSALQLLSYSEQGLQQIPPATIVPLAISDKGLQQLIAYVDASLATDSSGAIVPLPGVAVDGLDIGIFFKANSHYSLFNNCNTWTGRALQLAGLPFADRLTAQGVFKQARAISEIQARAGLFKGVPAPLVL